MSNESNQLAVRPTASNTLAAFIGMEPRMMLDTIKAQCFKGSRPEQISDAQLAAFVSIANEMKVNPLLPGMLYAYPSQGAIVPMMGPDGVFKKLAEHPQIESWETTVFPEDVTQPPTHCVAKIYRKGIERPLTYTALLSEWKIENNPNWRSRPRHMLTIRALKQCARQIIHGIPFDEDEKAVMDMVNVTPADEKPVRPPPPPRAKKGAAAIDAEIVSAPVAAPEEPKPFGGTGAETIVTPAVAPTPPTPAPDSHPDLEAAAPEPVAVSAKTSLAIGESVEGEFGVLSVSTSIEKFKGETGPVDYGVVTAEVKGPAYFGMVRCIKGATIQGDKAVALPAWAVGNELNLKLVGKDSKKHGVHASVAAWEPVNPEAV